MQRASTPAVLDGIQRDDAVKKPWEPPTLTKLPRLTELTLQTGGGIGGGGSGGSTVFA